MNETFRRDLGRVILAVLGLTILLACVFHKSFAPQYLLFANDAPLGGLKAYSDDVLANIGGVWANLNWLGMAQPAATPSFTNLGFVLLGPIYYSKFFAAICLVVLGLSAWYCLRKHNFHPTVCFAGAIAAALNMNSFSAACWGLPSRGLAMATAFFAIGLLRSSTQNQTLPKLALAGFAVGLGIMEAYDVGAIYSFYVAAFGLFLYWMTRSGAPVARLSKAVGSVALIAFCAGFVSTQTLSTLVGTQVQNVVGMEQTAEAKNARWNEATQWSLPKVETIRVLIPGFFGYRMDTPDGGAYWGAVGQAADWPQTHMGYSRNSGAGEYAGLLVALLALWAVVQALRGDRGSWSQVERRIVLFWAAAALVSLLLAYGRYAPFYQFVYALPYFSMIRNPLKFMHPFHLSILILFGYGLQDLASRYLHASAQRTPGIGKQIKAWWVSATEFERKWIYGCVAGLGISLLGWLLLIASKSDLAQYLQTNGIDPKEIPETVAFCVAETGWYVFYFLLSLGAVFLILSRVLTGNRKVWGWICILGILTIDLWRSNVPWIIHYDYRARYASNPVLDFLRADKTHARVTAPLYLASQEARFFPAICNDWLQQHFQYYRIPSLDVIQMSREPNDHRVFMRETFAPNPARLYLQRRLWELTSTRFVLGMSGFLEALNTQFDAAQKRFRIANQFTFEQRAGGAIDTVVQPNGPFAVFEFSGALPRVSLYTNWVAEVPDSVALERLASDAFDPHATVLIADPLEAPSTTGAQPDASAPSLETVAFKPQRVVVDTKFSQSSVLLLTDRYDTGWSVKVDGQPAKILRCNYLMRGVHLTPGAHRVEFHYSRSLATFYVSSAGVVLAGLLSIFLLVNMACGCCAKPVDRAGAG